MKLWSSILFLVLLAAVAAALWQGATASDLIIGLATGVLAGWVWAWIDLGRRKYVYRKAIRALEGTYRVRRKGDRTTDLGTVTLKLTGTVLCTSSAGKEPPGSWQGQIVMSETLPTSGSGSYHHTTADGWGIHTVQVRGRELLVHAEYVRDRTVVVDAYVWEPLAVGDSQ
jgi:hypothetical protein